jgi:hypothetical protein
VTDLIMSTAFDNADRILSSVAEGSTLTEACQRAGVNLHTCRKWISAGRSDSESKYASFATALDAARTQRRLYHEEEEGDYELGPVEQQVVILIRGRQLDDQAKIAATQARALARQVDTLAASRSGSAALGLAAVSRRLDELVASLRIQPADALTEMQERRIARLQVARAAAAVNGAVA